ncbi:MAG: hypothetical protein VX278_22710, partial [Myxococcota bacterium]|nr:hypothetical protein [Myxococcota bacterium]
AGASAKSLPKWEQTSHYSLPSAGNNNMEMSEGTALWLQAKWHEDQAVSILKESGKATELAALTLAPWRLPFEAKIKNELPDATSTLSDDWLFFSFFLVPQDAHFLAAMSNNPQDALNTWKDKSILATLLAKCMDSGKIIPERVIDASAVLEKDILTLVKERTDIPLFYEVFPLFAKYSLLRAGALFAEANGQHRDSGMLRLNVREASGPVRDPVFLIAFSAWEAGNKSTQRAQDLIHEYASQFPALHSARVPLDSLHIRRGKETVPVGPTH